MHLCLMEQSLKRIVQIALITVVINLLTLFCVTNSTPLGCSSMQQSFELITGFMYNAQDNVISQVPDTLHLVDCLSFCRQNESCVSVNFETGLCVLFNSSAAQRPDELTTSQYPVFTIYAQKICLEEITCHRAWIFERVPNYEFLERSRKIISNVSTTEKCMELCLRETEFECRSANFHRQRGVCKLSDVDRHSVQHNFLKYFVPAEDGTEYLENNCLDLPGLCEFSPINGKILKTVDAIFPDVKTLEGCREKCLKVDYRCQSFDMGDPNNNVCRLSHLASTSLANIEDPYLEMPGVTTFEITSCYNVTIHCHPREMVAFVHTNKVFNGKVYAKSRPNSCVTDVINSLDFEIRMAYHDLNCDVKQHDNGIFTNNIVIQHHDMIVTNQDLGLKVHCQYNLSNKSMSLGVQLDVNNNVNTFNYSVDVTVPNVSMKVTDPHGHDLFTAEVGDPLLIQFQITDMESPYDIFVRELVAMDGIDNGEILLIDALGCPTDPMILGALSKNNDSQKTLQTSFEAFKFPTTEIVQFKALVTPCLPACKPAECALHTSEGVSVHMTSFGRKRRRRSMQSLKQHGTLEQKDEVVVVQAIHITDKFKFTRKSIKTKDIEDFNTGAVCFNVTGLVVACSFILLIQLVIFLSWAYVWLRRRRRNRRACICKDASRSIDMIYSNRRENSYISICEADDTPRAGMHHYGMISRADNPQNQGHTMRY